MTREESHRAPWQALVRTLTKLLDEAKIGSLVGLSLHGTEAGELRTSYVLRDGRRDVDLPGVRREVDETDFEDADTDVDRLP